MTGKRNFFMLRFKCGGNAIYDTSQRYIKNVIFYARSIRKVKTVTIFVGKKRSAGFPCLIEC